MTAFVQMLFPLVGGVLAGIGALLAVLWLAPRGRGQVVLGDTDIRAEPRQFRFRHGYLIEHSENVSFLLPTPINHLAAWDDLIDSLTDVADGAVAAFEALRSNGRPMRLEGQLGRDRILVLGLRDGEDIRVTVASADAEQSSVRIDLPALHAMESEIELLARSGDTNPSLSWAVDDTGRVVWSNAGYIDLVGRCAGPDAAQGWPLQVLFPDDEARDGTFRRQVRDLKGQDLWYEVTATPRGPDGLRHIHAHSLDAVIKAEDSLRTFIQTLTKTFAFLPTGLAIFDRNGQLALFNPALLDMTGLDGAWLSRRPLMADVLDALRDLKKLPEPRDYKAWRDGLTGLGQNGETAPHAETWTLPSGATYRVSLRPQSDGAISLMLEDVSAEIRADRTHREERETMSGLLDQLQTGLVAFEPNGMLSTANDAAQTIWLPEGAEDAARLPSTLDGCTAFWKTLCRPSSVWGDLRAFARSPESERTEWSEVLLRDDSPPVNMRVIPMINGRLALEFSEVSEMMPPPESVPVARTARA